MRTIATKRAGLDAEELHWLREAEALQIWRPLGMVSLLDYLERVFGYTPRIAAERLRVSRALSELPRLDDELASGRLTFSAVRELTRVATSATEAAWIAAASGKTVRQIEDLVSGHRPGDQPDDPADPEVRTHVVRFELAATTFALLRQARHVLDDESGRRLSDDELIASLCNAILDGAPAAEPTGRAKFQIAVTVCERCQQAWQEGAGAAIPIDAAALERARCEAQHIGSLDGDAPERAYQDIPPGTVRFVWRRDGGRCRVPGCRSARGLEIHHLVHRANGGSHDACNLCLLCSSCHMAHHRGALAISGTANQLVVHRPGDTALPGDRTATLPENRDTHVWTRHQAPPARSRNPHVGAISADRSIGDRDTRAGAHHHAPPANVDNPHVGATSAAPSIGDRDTHVQTRHHAPPANDDNPHVGAIGAASTTGGRDTHVRTRHPAQPASDHNTRVGTISAAPSTGDRDTHVRTRHPAPPVSIGSPHVGADSASPQKVAASKLDTAVLRVEAKRALVGLGWKPAIAEAAVAGALGAIGPAVPLEQLIFEALRRCQRPSSLVQNPLRGGSAGSSSSASNDSAGLSSKW